MSFHSAVRVRPFAFALLLAAPLLLRALPPGPALHAAGGTTLQISKVDVAAQNPPHVVAHVTVAGPNGVPVSGLTQDNFQVTSDGKPVDNLAIAAAQNDQQPVAVALVLDVSGSMNQNGKLQGMKQAATAFVNGLAPQDPLALIAFGQTVRVLMEPSTDRGAALAAIDGLTAGGDTPLWDATSAAVARVAGHTGGPRAVLLMTDGADTNSGLTQQALIAGVGQTGVPIFAVGFGPDVVAGPLQLLASATGGQYLAATTADELQNTFGQVSGQLRTEYTAAFDALASNQAKSYTLSIAANVQGETVQNTHGVDVPAVISPHVSVSIGSPASGLKTSDPQVHLAATVEPAVSAKSVRFLADGTPFATVDKPPFAADWPTSGASTGRHTLRVEATGIDGQTESAETAVDYTDPHVTVALLAPKPRQRLSGDVKLAADVSPEASVRELRFLADGKPVATLTAPPWTAVWPTRGVLIGGHALRVEATGADGQTESAEATIDLGPADSNGPLIFGVSAAGAAIVVVIAAMVIARRRRQQLAAARREAPEEQAEQPDALVGGLTGVNGVSPNGHVPPIWNPPPPGPMPLGWLVEANGSQHAWPLWPGETLIGREVSATDVLLDDIDVSRRHAAVREEGGVLVYHDLGPTNPTVINGQRFTDPHPLQDGDALDVGGVRLVYRSTNPASSEEG